MRRSTPCLAIVALSLAYGQSRPNLTEFDVASVKPHPEPTGIMGVYTSGETLDMKSSYPVTAILYAYNLKNYQLEVPNPAPAVLNEKYDIVAKAPAGIRPTEEEFRQMLRVLLEDRFKLKVHHEMRERPVYALVAGKNGPKLKPAEAEAEATGHLQVTGREYEITKGKASMSDVTEYISNAFLDRPVVDRTGLGGFYDLHLIYTPNVKANTDAPDSMDLSVFTAVQEQLGLRLEPQRATIDVVVLDHIEVPSGN